MTTDPENKKHIIASEGKVLRRKADGHIYGTEIYLGYTHYINGVLQDPPHKDAAKDFDEIDAPEEVDEEPTEELVEE